jgi:hypothetical protein
LKLGGIDVITFLPYPSFAQSASCLDGQRLRNQAFECVQILKALWGLSSAWANHPAVRMWRGYDQALNLYAIAVCDEIEARGWVPTWRNAFIEYDGPYQLSFGEKVHSSHRANLLRKDPEHYSQFGWTEQPRKGYVWPA